jgi:hypothetical protein
MSIFILGVILVLFDASRHWISVLRGAEPPKEAFGAPETAEHEVKMGCC